MTPQKCWQNKGVGIMGVARSISSTGRLIVVHVVDGAALVFRSGLTTGYYHGHMNRENFEKWLTEKLLPNIPQNSVIVFDNAPYHSQVENKIPTKYSTKTEISSWLDKNHLNYNASWRKV